MIVYKKERAKRNWFKSSNEKIQKFKSWTKLVHFWSKIDTRLGAELSILQKKLGIDHDVILKELEEMREISVAFHYESEQL